MNFSRPSRTSSVPSLWEEFPSPWEGFSKGDGSLATIVEGMIRTSDLSGYFLTIAYHSVFRETKVFQSFIRASNSKQILELSDNNVLENVLWNLNIYVAVIFLITKPDIVVDFCNDNKQKWNYNARFIVIAQNLNILEEIISCKKAFKTKQIIGLVPKKDNKRTWAVYASDVFHPKTLKLLRPSSSSKYFLYKDPKDFKQRELIVAAFEYAPSVLYMRNKKGEVVSRYGIEIFLAEACAQHLNFKIKYVESNQDEMWGCFLPNGSYSGLLGMINTGQGDIGLGNNFISDVSSLFVDTAFPFMFSATCFMNIASPPVPKWMSIFHPFQIVSWITIIVVLICTGIILQFYIFASAKLERNNIKTRLPSIFVAFALHLQQPAEIRVEKGKSIQVYLMFLGLYTLILTNAYSSNLTSFLTVKKRAKQINKIEELKDSGLNVFLINSFLGGVLKSAADQNLRSLAERITIVPGGWEKILPLVAKRQGVFLQAETYLQYVATIFEKENRHVTNFRIIKECFNSFYVTVAVEHHSIYKNHIDEIIMRLVEGGIVSKIIADTFERIRKENNIGADSLNIINADIEPAPTIVTLSLEHLQGAFLIYGIGVAFAVLSFMFELIGGKLRKSNGRLSRQYFKFNTFFKGIDFLYPNFDISEHMRSKDKRSDLSILCVSYSFIIFACFY